MIVCIGCDMQVKAKHKVSSLKGGNVIAAGSDSISCPHNCTSAQWEVLSKSYNNTQLFAIKYVADRYTPPDSVSLLSRKSNIL